MAADLLIFAPNSKTIAQ